MEKPRYDLSAGKGHVGFKIFDVDPVTNEILWDGVYFSTGTERFNERRFSLPPEPGKRGIEFCFTVESVLRRHAFDTGKSRIHAIVVPHGSRMKQKGSVLAADAVFVLDVVPRDTVIGIALKVSPFYFFDLSPEERTNPSYRRAAVRKNGNALLFLRPEERTPDVIRLALRTTPLAIKHLTREERRNSDRAIALAVEGRASLLEVLTPEEKTVNVLVAALKSSRSARDNLSPCEIAQCEAHALKMGISLA